MKINFTAEEISLVLGLIWETRTHNLISPEDMLLVKAVEQKFERAEISLELAERWGAQLPS